MNKEKLLQKSLTFQEIAGSDRVLLLEVRPVKNQGNRDIQGFAYTVMCRPDVWKKFDVIIPGKQLVSQDEIKANGRHIVIKFIDFEGYVDEENTLSATATGIKVIT